MDRQALRFIDMLNDETQEDGRDKYDIQLKMRLFQMGQDWLVRRKKLKPEGDGNTEGSGITDMRQWMADPDVQKTMEKVMFDAGFVKVPAKRNGRPRREEQPVHDRHREYKEATKQAVVPDDDSGLRKLLGEN